MDSLASEYNAISYDDEEITEKIINMIDEKINEIYYTLEDVKKLKVFKYETINTTDPQTVLKIYRVISNCDETYIKLEVIIDIEIWDNIVYVTKYSVGDGETASAQFINGKMGYIDGVPTPLEETSFYTGEIEKLLEDVVSEFDKDINEDIILEKENVNIENGQTVYESYSKKLIPVKDINDDIVLEKEIVKVENGQIICDFDSNKAISDEKALKLCYNFAAGMNGNHNNDKIQHRMVWEIFRDDFRGKYSEIAVRNSVIADLKEYSIKTDLDFKIEPKGKWDTTDLDIIKKGNDESDYESISVKGVKKRSSNLLIEKERFNEDGSFSYKNADNSEIKVDIHVLVEVDINKEIDKYIYKDSNGEYHTDNTNGKFLSYDKVFGNRKVTPIILGAISHKYFWKIKSFAPKGIICSSGNLYHISEHKDKFNEKNIKKYLDLPEYYTDDNGNRCFYKEGAIANIFVWENGKRTNKMKRVKPGEKDYPVILKQDNYFVTKYKLKSLKKVLELKKKKC